jgi:hypothetical protein
LGLAVTVAEVAFGQTPAPMLTHALCIEDVRRMLGAFVGRWTVHTAYRTGTATLDSSLAAATIEPELGGCILREVYHGRRFGKPFAFVALWGVHGGTQALPVQRTYVHSQHGLLTLSEGSWNADGDTLTLKDSAMVRGQWVEQQTVVSRPSGGAFVIEGRRSEDGGRTWIMTQQSRYQAPGPARRAP